MTATNGTFETAAATPGTRSSSGPCSTSDLHRAGGAGLQDRVDAGHAHALVQAALGVRVAVVAQQDVVLLDLASCGLPTRKSSMPPARSDRRLNRNTSSFVAWGVARKADAAPRVLELRGHDVEGGRDRRLLPRRAPDGARARRRRACRSRSPCTRAPDVAHPGLVDVDVAARPQAVDLAVALVDVDVAAGRAPGADRVGGLQEPDAHLEAEVVGEQRAHRADVGQVAGVVVGDGPVLEGARSACGRRGSRTRSEFVPVTLARSAGSASTARSARRRA